MPDAAIIVLAVLLLADAGVTVHLLKRTREQNETIRTLSTKVHTLEKALATKPVLRVPEPAEISKEELEREIILLHLKGYSIRQIARVVGKSKSYVHKVIKQAKEKGYIREKKKKEAEAAV